MTCITEGSDFYELNHKSREDPAFMIVLFFTLSTDSNTLDWFIGFLKSLMNVVRTSFVLQSYIPLQEGSIMIVVQS